MEPRLPDPMHRVDEESIVGRNTRIALLPRQQTLDSFPLTIRNLMPPLHGPP